MAYLINTFILILFVASFNISTASANNSIGGNITQEMSDAELGDLHEQIRLCENYHAEKNYKEAFKWCSVVGNRGVGMFQRGDMYEKGQGVSQDFEQAYFWKLLSAFYHSDAIGNTTIDALDAAKKLSLERRRAVLNRVASHLDQRDGWFVYLLGCAASDTNDYEEAYFWFSATKNPGANIPPNVEDRIEEVLKKLQPWQKNEIDKRLENWVASYGASMTEQQKENADEVMLSIQRSWALNIQAAREYEEEQRKKKSAK